MSKGLKGPSLELGRSPAPAVSIGGQLNLSPVKLVTLPLQVLNPVKALKTLGDMVGASKGKDVLGAAFGVTEQLTSLLQGNPKIFLQNALGAGDAGKGGLMAQAEKGLANVAGKAAEVGVSAVGKAGGMLSNKLMQGTGTLLQAIPIIGTATGLALKAAAPMVDQAIQQAGKFAGKVAAHIVKQAVQTASRVVRAVVGMALKQAVQAGKQRGPCKVVSKSKAQVRGEKPALLHVKKVTQAVLASVRATIQRLHQGGRLVAGKRQVALPKAKTGPLSASPVTRLKAITHRLRAVIKRSQPVVRAVTRPAAFLARSGRSALGSAQSAAHTINQFSQVGEKLGRGQADEAAKALQGGLGAAKGSVKQAVAPAQEGLKKAWTKGKSLGSQRLASMPFRPSTSPLKPTETTPAPSPAQGRAQPSVAPPTATKASLTMNMARSALRTLQVPVKLAREKMEPLLSLARNTRQTLGAPIRVLKAGGGITSDVAKAGKSLAQAPLAFSKAGESLGRGDSSAALSNAQSGTDAVLSAPDALSPISGRIGGLKPAPVARKANPPGQQAPLPTPPRSHGSGPQEPPSQGAPRRLQPVLKAVQRARQVVSVPVRALKGGVGILGDLAKAARATAQAPLAFSKAGEALAKGDSSAALSHAQGGVDALSSAPGALASSAGRVRGMKPYQPPQRAARAENTPDRPAQHFSASGKSLWSLSFSS